MFFFFFCPFFLSFHQHRSQFLGTMADLPRSTCGGLMSQCENFTNAKGIYDWTLLEGAACDPTKAANIHSRPEAAEIAQQVWSFRAGGSHWGW